LAVAFLRHALRHFRQAEFLGEFALCQPIDTSRAPRQHPFLKQPSQRLRMDALRGQVFDPQNLLLSCKLQHTFFVCPFLRHV
jgi:hypothetical protein